MHGEGMVLEGWKELEPAEKKERTNNSKYCKSSEDKEIEDDLGLVV